MILYPISTAFTAHTIASHIDTLATGGQLNTLVGGDNAARAFLGLGLLDSPVFAGLRIKNISDDIIFYVDDDEMYFTALAAIPIEAGMPIGLALALTYASP